MNNKERASIFRISSQPLSGHGRPGEALLCRSSWALERPEPHTLPPRMFSSQRMGFVSLLGIRRFLSCADVLRELSPALRQEGWGPISPAVCPSWQEGAQSISDTSYMSSHHGVPCEDSRKQRMCTHTHTPIKMYKRHIYTTL